MTLTEKLIIKANKKAMDEARKQGIITEVILEAIEENTKEKIEYLLDNNIITLEELITALSEAEKVGK